MSLFGVLPLELGCEVTDRIPDVHSLRRFRESSVEAQEIVDSCVSKIRGLVAWNDLLALPSVSEVEGEIRAGWRGWDDILRQIRGSISISPSIPLESLIPVLDAMYVRKALYPLSRVQFRDGTQMLSWDGSRKSLKVVYRVAPNPTVFQWKVIEDASRKLARLTSGIQELTYFGRRWIRREFWDSINPLRLRMVTMNSYKLSSDPLYLYLAGASSRFQLRISTLRLEPLTSPNLNKIDDNWGSEGEGIRRIYSTARSTQYLQELYGLTIPAHLPPAALQNVAHALKDLKVIVTDTPPFPRITPRVSQIRPPIPFSSLTPTQQTRAQLFLNAFPSIPITFH